MQALLKQRDAALSSLTAQLENARGRPGSGPRPLSRSNSGVKGEVADNQRLKQLEVRQNRGGGKLLCPSSDVLALLPPSAPTQTPCPPSNQRFPLAQHCSALQEELAFAQSRIAELTPRRPSRRESVEDSGMAVVGSGAGMSSFDANRLR